MKTYKEVTVRQVVTITCDGCGLEATDEIDFDFQEFISIKHDCGYGSIHGDGNKISIDLCQKCFSDKCGDSLRIIDESTETNKLEYNNIFEVVTLSKSEASLLKEKSDLELILRDILVKKEVNNKHELSVALKRVEQLWDAHYESPEGEELNQLADLICAYEKKDWSR